MKRSLSSQYKAVVREELFPHGFRLYKKTFYRVINDVVQTVMLRNTSSDFTVDFNIYPLCILIDDLYCEGHDISTLRGKFFSNGGWWDFYEGEVEENAFEELTYLLREYVIPFFERGTTSKTAYEELIKHEKTIYTGIPGGVIMNNYRFVLMCVKAQDYEMAYKHMEAIIKQNFGLEEMNLYEKIIRLISDVKEKKKDMNEYNLFIEQFKPRLQERIGVLQRISIPDVEYFQNLIAQNEAISLEYLRNPGKRK